MTVHPLADADFALVRPSDLIADLVAAFPRDRVTPETVRVYLAKLDDVPPQLLEVAINELICTCERLPTISQIRTMVAELTLGLPSETEALAQIWGRMSWRRADEATRGPAPPLTPEVAEALAHVGGFNAFRESEDDTIIRGQFARYYREIRSARLRQLQVIRLPRMPELEHKPQLAVS